MYKGSNRFMNETMKTEIRLIPIACVPHKTSIFLQVMVVQQSKQVKKCEKDEARIHEVPYRPHMLLFGTGELFLFAKFSFIFSSIRFLNSVIT